MNNKEQIQNTKLFKELFKQNQAILKNNINAVLNKSNLILKNQFELYVYDAFKIALNITNSIEQLEYIPLFLKKYPLRKYYSSCGIEEANYYKYHLENHNNKSCTLFDQTLYFTSLLYDLGIPRRGLSLEDLRKNKHTKTSESVEILKEFNHVDLKEIRPTRNKIVHEGVFKDEDIDEISKYLFVTQLDYPMWEDTLSQKLLKGALKETIIERVEEIENINAILNNRVESIFISLESIYENIKSKHVI